MRVPVSISLIFDSSCYDEERKIVKEKIVKEKKSERNKGKKLTCHDQFFFIN
jgi:hypothetical protein